MEEYIITYINNNPEERVPEKVRGIVSCWSCYFMDMIQPELGIEKIHDKRTSSYSIRKSFVEVIIKYYNTSVLVIVIPKGRKKRTRGKLGAAILISDLDRDNTSFVGDGEKFIDFLDSHKSEILKFFNDPPIPLI